MSILKNPIIYLMIGIDLFILGAILLIKGYETWGFFFITLAFAFFTLYQGFRSHEQLQQKQDQLQDQIKQSEDQIILNQNEIFERLIDRFGDVRINLLWSIPKMGYSLFEYTIWRCRTLVDRAWKLVKYSTICKENQKRLFNEMRNLVYHSEIGPWERFTDENINFKPSKNDLNNLLTMCKKFKDFDLKEKNDIEELEGMEKLFKDLFKKLYGKEI